MGHYELTVRRKNLFCFSMWSKVIRRTRTRPTHTNCGAFGGFSGAVRGQIVDVEGPRGTFGMGKSSCMCRVATISLHLAALSKF